LGGFGGSWGALWGSVAPLDANMADKCDKRGKKTFCPDPTTTFSRKNVAQGRPKGAKMETKGRQGTPKWSPRGAKIDKKQASETKLKICKKRQRVVQKSTFGGLEVEPKGRRKDKKGHREK